MGYELHITRADVYEFDEEGMVPHGGITLEEWKAYAENHEEMSVGGSFGSVPIYLYHSHSTGEALSFTWVDGTVDVNGGRGTPDETNELVVVAHQLGAKLFGDEGEEYKPPSRNSSSVGSSTDTKRAKATWWRWRPFSGR